VRAPQAAIATRHDARGIVGSSSTVNNSDEARLRKDAVDDLRFKQPWKAFLPSFSAGRCDCLPSLRSFLCCSLNSSSITLRTAVVPIKQAPDLHAVWNSMQYWLLMTCAE
jgi:hypothetical protein